MLAENSPMAQTSIYDFVEDTHYSYRHVLDGVRPIRLFEAFAGVGCQRMALNRLNIPYESVGISEIDKYALLAYEAIHGDCRNYGDITKMTYIPQCDIFTWSFPCTDLSKAGKQKGLNGGTRSGLVYEVLRLLRVTENKPKVLIMENVVDLVQVKFAAQFYEIQKELEKLGYQNYTQVLNGKDYGVAQNRERVFMVSILGGGRYEFPLQEVLTKRLKDYLEPSVDEKYYLSNAKIESISQWNAQQDPLKDIEIEKIVSPCLTARGAGEEHSGMVLISEPLINHAPGGRNYKSNGWNDVAQTLLARDYKDPKIIMVSEPIIKKVGSYNPSGYSSGVVLDSNGISGTVMENHGTVQAILTNEPIKLEQVAQLETGNESRGRVYSKDGLCPTIDTSGGGGREPKIVEPYLIDPQGRLSKECKPLHISPTLRAQIHGNPPQVVEQSVVIPNDVVASETTNLKAKMCNELIENGKVKEFDVIRHSYTKSRMNGEMKDIQENNMSPTIDTRADCLGVVVGVSENMKAMIDENGNVKRYLESDVVDEFSDGDCADLSFPNGYNKARRVTPGYAQAITCATVKNLVTKNQMRIRKLTPLECWRLMGISDDDFYKAQAVVSNSQLYKLAGNGIIIDVFQKLLQGLL